VFHQGGRSGTATIMTLTPRFLRQPGGPNARRGFIATLLLLIGVRSAAPRPTGMVERDGWFLDASDR
jgi:hypothetical protein